MVRALKNILKFIWQHPLAKRHLFKAYFNTISWQIKSAFIKKPLIVKFIEHTKFYAERGLNGITGNIYTGLHEFEDMGFLIHFLKAEDVFFDVGANVGSYTILASGLRQAKSIAFEPIPKSYTMLTKNVELNKLENLVQCENKGVGNKEGKLNFIDDEDTKNHIVLEQNYKSIAVDIVALDKFYPHFKPSLIKIDVEGFETEVLNGAKKILNDPTLKAIIIELNGSGERYGFDDLTTHNSLLAAKFLPYSYNPFKRELTRLNLYGKVNTIYIRDIDYVNNRLNTAPSFMVFNQKI